jgi:hypothetical protein
MNWQDFKIKSIILKNGRQEMQQEWNICFMLSPIIKRNIITYPAQLLGIDNAKDSDIMINKKILLFFNIKRKSQK